MNVRSRFRNPVPVAVLALSLLLSACGDGGTTAAPVADPSLPGPYPVGVTRVEFFDVSRGRTLLTEIWYPADESARGEAPAPAETYLPEGLGFLADNATVPLVAVRDVPLAPGAPFPLAIFSHGSGGIRFQNSFQCEHLASHGFIVVAMDHQGNTFFDDSGEPEQLREDRPLDLLYTLDRFVEASGDPGSPFEGWVDRQMGIGAFGHSFGAFTSLAAAGLDSRIDAVYAMALGGPVASGYDAATFLALATVDNTIGPVGNDAIYATYDLLPAPRFLSELEDAGHYSFSFACQTGLGIGDGDGCGTGVRFDGSEVTFISDLAVWGVTNTYSAAFFGRYIKGITGYDEVLTTTLAPEFNRYSYDLGD